MTFDESKLPPGWLPGDPVPEPEPPEPDAPPQPDGSVQSGWALKLVHELVWGKPLAWDFWRDAPGPALRPFAPLAVTPPSHVWEYGGRKYNSFGAFRSYDEWNEANQPEQPGERFPTPPPEQVDTIDWSEALQRAIDHARLPEPPSPTIAPERVADADDLDISDGGE